MKTIATKEQMDIIGEFARGSSNNVDALCALVTDVAREAHARGVIKGSVAAFTGITIGVVGAIIWECTSNVRKEWIAKRKAKKKDES